MRLKTQMRRTTPRNNFWTTTFGAAAATIAAAALCPLAGVAQQPHASTPDVPASVALLEQTFVDIIARAEPSVVAIGRTSPQQLALAERRVGDVFLELRDNASGASPPLTVGAGVIIDRAGLVLTHYLAVHEGDQHTVTTIDRTTYAATIRAADPRSGLAILAIDTKAAPLQRAGAPAHWFDNPKHLPCNPSRRRRNLA